MAKSRAVEAESERLIFFSDAVMAIAITLLALELPVPHGHDLNEVWHNVRHDGGHYLSFLIGFNVIAAMWNGHHRVFQFVARSDNTLRQQGMVWLFTVVLIPFATKLLVVGGGVTRTVHAVMFSFYAVVQVAAGLIFMAMTRHALSASLMSDDAPPGLARNVHIHSMAMIIPFAVSIPLSFLTPYVWVLWIVGPSITTAIWLRLERGGRGEGAH